MRTHTSDFKEKIKLFGRQIKGKIIYYHSYDLISESDDNILTEADLQLISEQANYDDPVEIEEENIFSISIIKNGDLLQSLMKEFDFEAKVELNIGSVVNPHFGLLIDDENQTYEYLDYGNYIVNSKEFNMDTQTWSYVCFDKMLFAMVKYRPLTNVTYPITIKQYINLMCNKIGLEFEDSNFVNYDQLIYEDLYKDKGLTYRDVFDEISKIVAGNLLINDDDKLEVGYSNKIKYSDNTSGSDISIEAVAEPILDVKLEGDTQQTTTTGKNLSKIVDGNISIGGLDITIEDGIITLNGTTTSNLVAKFSNNLSGNTGSTIPADWLNEEVVSSTTNKTFSINVISGTAPTTGFAVRTYVNGSMDVNANSLQNNRTFTKTYSSDGIMNYIGIYTNTGKTFNNFKFTIQLENGTEVTSFEPYTGGIPSPNPDYPQNVNVVTGEQKIEIIGKNLFDKSTITSVTNGTNNDGLITSNNINVDTSYNVIPYFTTKKMVAGTYTYSFQARLQSGTSTINKFNDGIADGTNIVKPNLSNEFQTYSFTKTYNTDTNVVRLLIQFVNSTNAIIEIKNIQIEKGNSATSFQEYQNQNFTIDLGSTELCKLGTSQDYIYENNGDWYLHKETETEILPSSDTTNRVWTKSGVNKNNTFIYTFRDHYLKVGSAIYSNMFLEYTATYLTNNNIYGCAYNTTEDGNPSIRVGMTLSGVSTVANFRTWLSTNQPTFYYELATPTDTQITDTSLIQQLNNLKNATLFNGINNITVSGNLSSILNLDYISKYESINEDYLKDTNVKMAEKFGVINSVAVLDTDNDLQYIAEDTQSIKENELTRITITDNLIALNGDSQTIADNVLNQLNGLYYYINDFTTTGVCYYDFLDMFDVEARGNVYQCLLLNNEITISQGIEEQIFTKKLEESETSANEYTTSVMSNKQVQFKINQQEGKIESKVEKDGVISAINQSAEEIKIQANKLSFEGATIDMTADNIKIKGDNLDIDSDGKITLTDNSAESASLFEDEPDASYLIESEVTTTYQGNIENLKLKNKLFALGRHNRSEVDDITNNNSYIVGIQENLYRSPYTRWYAQTGDYDFQGGTGIRNTISVFGGSGTGTGIYFEETNNGVYSNPLKIETDGKITCVSVIQTSKAESKKNFEKLANAKEILNDTDIYKYNFINEDNNAKKSIGFVIGDNFNYSQEITSENNDGANIYSMVSVLWQVVKEQQEEIQELKEMIKNGKY